MSDNALRSALIDKPIILNTDFLDRGSDEPQYCSPNVDLPVCGFSRSKYATYPEYHTSEDNLKVVTEAGLNGSLAVLKDIIDSLERGCTPISKCIGEPRLGKRGLYNVGDNIGNRDLNTVHIENIMAYSNGTNTTYDIFASVKFHSLILSQPLINSYPIISSDLIISSKLYCDAIW